MEELVEKAKVNNTEAFSELIRSIEKELYHIARTRLRNEDDICDAIQETIIKSYKNIHKLKENHLFRAWVVKILINECNNIYRKNKSRNKNNMSYELNNLESYLIQSDDSFDKLGFEILIKDLEDDERLILTLYYYYKYTTKDISKIVKIKENTIKSKLARARNKIRGKLEKEEQYD